MDKNEFKEQTCEDFQGNVRWKDSKKLVHRGVAYKEIYLKNRKKYPLKFREYQVHHKDKNKKNNRIENLELIPKKEHEKRHGVIRREQLHINYLQMGIIGFLGIMSVEELSKRLGFIGITKAFMFFCVFIITFFLGLWVSREKKGVKYI